MTGNQPPYDTLQHPTAPRGTSARGRPESAQWKTGQMPPHPRFCDVCGFCVRADAFDDHAKGKKRRRK
eukprot:10352043-Lingulodinium_polyedra.AAC.1